MAKQTKADMEKTIDMLRETVRVKDTIINNFRKDILELEKVRIDERQERYEEGYAVGYGHARQQAIDLISDSINDAKTCRNECTMAGNEVGINNINSGILSFSTIKIKLMENM